MGKTYPFDRTENYKGEESFFDWTENYDEE